MLSKKHSFDTVFDGQKVYRLILEAMSNPTRTVHIGEYANKLYGDHPVFLAVAITLLDNEVSFHTCDNQVLSDEIASLTLAKRERIETADFVFADGAGDIKKTIENVKSGTPADPHKSTTVIIMDDSEPALELTFSGPGINGNKTTRMTTTAQTAVALRDAQLYEYPQGIDLIFISSKGELFAVPRMTRMEAK